MVVTGAGVVAANGIGTLEFWESQLASRSGLGKLSRFEPYGPFTPVVAELEIPPRLRLADDEIARTDRCTQLAAAAAQLAIDDSGLSQVDPAAVGVMLGTAYGGIESLEDSHRALLESGPGAVQARFVPMSMPNNAPAWIAIHHGFTGPTGVTTSACASSADALIAARQMIVSGEAEVVLAGGAEAPIVPHVMAGFDRLSVMSTCDVPAEAFRPFSRDRSGSVLGEGAALLVLESASHAAARGAAPVAEFAGYGRTSDAYHMCRLDPAAVGPEQAIVKALRSAGLRPEQVQHVNAHGSGTRLNDAVEALALRRVFRDRDARPAVVASKSLTGHTLGATAALEAVATVQAIANGVVPPTLGADPVDPELDIDVVTGAPREVAVRAALTNSFGFGGHNSVLAFTAP
ncbi:beta-ketoacyl-[acyl-carrier-protein] synthase family protein [Saccharomonospora sp. NPDC046836]|uniref:beta-ketoacyl-[acyl-carrier-protein] synthase family protein n=1 Tax=Saccharomonospora sp. NPDC046836 TaxID=3156921 RepID=UPI0033ECD7FE